MPHDNNRVDNLAPDQAQAALDALNANKAAITAKEAVEFLKRKRALEVEVARGTQAIAGALNY
jgi:hypothetical protein